MDKKLEVRNLRVSFRTNNGTVKAVRDISFSLNKGETLAIVGESGSGKSVTAKAILGILAGNSIVEGGEIIYDGQDLLKFTEADFNHIRGNKVTMIFQDPMSSLDPIMKIGKQMTEATLLNGKTNRKNAKKDFKLKLKQLKEAMLKAGCDSAKVNEQISEFTKFVEAGSKMEQSYNLAHEYAESAVLSIDNALIELLGEDVKAVQEALKELAEKLDKVFDEFLFHKEDKQFTALVDTVKNEAKAYQGGSTASIKKDLEQLKEVLEAELSKEEPNFFTMGYYVAHEDKSKLHTMEVPAMNAMLREYVDSHFMLEFLGNVAKAIEASEKSVSAEKEKVIASLKEHRKVFEKETLEVGECKKAIGEMSRLVADSIDQLSLHKNSNAYTFKTTMETNITRYESGLKKNPKELARVEKEEAKRAKVIAKNGDAPKVVPAVLVDLDLTRHNMLNAMDQLQKSYEEELASTQTVDYSELAVAMVDYLKELSYAMANVITKQMAYDKAIRIMEDVGIKEPRKRFEQYPFEFSGGMRQRIVIAIAIAANPDVLICDEPTTALDVTIQAQILELINDLKKKRNLTVIFITHDLGVVANMADKVAVMYAGKIVEEGTVDDIFYRPAHPYTWALLSSMPDLDTKEKLEAIPGTPPNMIYPPVGDAFAARNKYAMQIDFEKQPPMFKISDTHAAATWLLHPDAPKVEPPKQVLDRIERMKKLEVQANEQ